MPMTSSASRFSRPRFALLVALGVYPLVTGLLYVVLPLTEGWMLWQRTLLVVPVMVPIMVWVSYRAFSVPLAVSSIPNPDDPLSCRGDRRRWYGLARPQNLGQRGSVVHIRSRKRHVRSDIASCPQEICKTAGARRRAHGDGASRHQI
ncbi:hypothetical protein [Mesorhizobium xinjiangense]|uniref:hypothetical protein n=1 Tax=Mesorhizobium xinjiangense TaxID=2678685 RepID=UPI001F359633|nr:hypothetical protein [Mesorhizobium xinjiangense]